MNRQNGIEGLVTLAFRRLVPRKGVDTVPPFQPARMSLKRGHLMRLSTPTNNKPFIWKHLFFMAQKTIRAYAENTA